MPEPKDVNARLKELGGVTLDGRPLYRCVWGSSRTEWIWKRSKGQYERKPKHYRFLNRWIIERWEPPAYTSAEWAKLTREYIEGIPVDLLGPYPNQGTYEYLWHAETPHDPECEVPVFVKGGDGGCMCRGGNYLQINVRMAEVLMDMVKLTRLLHHGDKKNKMIEAEQKKMDDWDKMADAAIADAGRPFGGNYFVPMTGQSPDHWPKDPKHRFVPD